MSCPCLMSSYERMPPNTTVDTVPARMTHACMCTAIHSLTVLPVRVIWRGTTCLHRMMLERAQTLGCNRVGITAVFALPMQTVAVAQVAFTNSVLVQRTMRMMMVLARPLRRTR